MSGKLKHFLEKSIDGIAVLFFAAIFVLVLAQIIMRWLFKNPLVWSEELIRLMYVWVCFIGWTLASRHRSHIKINFIIDALPPIPQKLLATANNLLLILFSLFMAYYGIKMAAVGAHGRAVTLPLNFALVYGVAPAANLIIILYHLTDIASVWGKAEQC